MGLDITAYSKMHRVEGCTADVDECYHTRAWVNTEFPYQADGVETGCYRRLDGSVEIRFRAGSYSGYNSWRDDLDKMRKGEDFQELVWFSDCEGTIGPKTSAKLAADFAKYREIAEHHLTDDGWRKYQDWQKAFEIASDGGYVSFH